MRMRHGMLLLDLFDECHGPVIKQLSFESRHTLADSALSRIKLAERLLKGALLRKNYSFCNLLVILVMLVDFDGLCVLL